MKNAVRQDDPVKRDRRPGRLALVSIAVLASMLALITFWMRQDDQGRVGDVASDERAQPNGSSTPAAVAGTTDGRIVVIDESGDEIRRLGRDRGSSLALSEDGTVAAATIGEFDGTSCPQYEVRTYDVASGSATSFGRGHSPALDGQRRRVAFTREQEPEASCTSTLVIADLDSRIESTWTHPEPHVGVEPAAFAEDGRLLARWTRNRPHEPGGLIVLTLDDDGRVRSHDELNVSPGDWMGARFLIDGAIAAIVYEGSGDAQSISLLRRDSNGEISVLREDIPGGGVYEHLSITREGELLAVTPDNRLRKVERDNSSRDLRENVQEVAAR